MLNEELLLKNIPLYLFRNFLENKVSYEDRYIMETLIDKYNNPERLNDFLANLTETDTTKYSRQIEELSTLQRTNIHPLLPSHSVSAQEVRPGQIWSVNRLHLFLNTNAEPVTKSRFMYILTGPEPWESDDASGSAAPEKFSTVIALPVSQDVEFATHTDYLCKPDNEQLGIPFMIQTSLETAVPIGLLKKSFGTFDDTQRNEVMELYFASNGMNFNKSIAENAPKGKFFDKDYGDKFDYKRIETANLAFFSDSLMLISNRINTKTSAASKSADRFHQRSNLNAAATGEHSPDALRVIDSVKVYEDDLLRISVEYLSDPSGSGDNFLVYIKTNASKTLLSRNLRFSASVEGRSDALEFTLDEKSPLPHYLFLDFPVSGKQINFEVIAAENIYCLCRVEL